jgi:hypothetical protein
VPEDHMSLLMRLSAPLLPVSPSRGMLNRARWSRHLCLAACTSTTISIHYHHECVYKAFISFINKEELLGMVERLRCDIDENDDFKEDSNSAWEKVISC